MTPKGRPCSAPSIPWQDRAHAKHFNKKRKASPATDYLHTMATKHPAFNAQINQVHKPTNVILAKSLEQYAQICS